MSDRLAASDILAAWEAGAGRMPLDRALAVLWAAGEVAPADLPLVDRDRRLLAIRAGTFGARLPARATCPDCGVELEMELDAAALIAALPEAGTGTGPRAMTSRDLAAVAGLPEAEVAAALRQLLCGDIGDAAAADARIAATAEAGELWAQLVCAGCGAEFAEVLDPAGHVWAEVEAAAFSLIGEVADLAAAYGWSEGEILALSPARRAAYLARARAS